jgi:hypothetical protein
MSASSRVTTGSVILALLGVLDISWMVMAWAGLFGSDVPPVLFFAAVGAITLAAVLPAHRGNRAAAWVVVASRVVSALLIDLPAFFLGAPAWTLGIVAAAIVLAALGIWWTAPLLGRGTPDRARTRALS